MTLKRQRVVVQLDEGDSPFDDMNGFPSILRSPNTIVSTENDLVLAPKQITADIVLVDRHTLQLSVVHPHSPQPSTPNFRLMNFDCVGTVTSGHTRAEVTLLMDELVLRQCDCFLMRYNAVRECQLSFLTRLLVTEVDKRLQMMQAKVHNIKLEYYDVRKYEVANLLAHSLPGISSNGSAGKGRRNVRSHLQFANTMDLLKWLQGRYLQFFAMGHGQEQFDLQYTFVNNERQVFDVKLSLLFVYLNKMDQDTKVCLKQFFDQMACERKRTKRKPIMLTDCLKEFFTPHHVWHTWFIFNVPMVVGAGMIVEDMLKMAQTVFVAFNAMHSSMDLLEEKSSFHLDLDSLVSCTKLSIAKSTSVHSRPSIKSGALESSCSRANNQSHISLVPKNRNSRSPLKETNSLSYWYSVCDERADSVITAMEAYYNCKYGSRVSKMCNEIKEMMRSGEKSSQMGLVNDFNKAEELKVHFSNYKTAMARFSRLVPEIEQSLFSESLKIYLKTKSYELKQHVVQFKIQCLDKFQQRLQGVIRNEVKSLTDSSLVNMQETGVH